MTAAQLKREMDTVELRQWMEFFEIEREEFEKRRREAEVKHG